MSTLPQTDVIIFYDISSLAPGKAWSPNTWKTRYLLNIKGLPYRTQWVELPDIADLLKSLGVSPNLASPFPYSLPAVYDPRTKRAIMDSAEIAKYLDDEYPATPVVIPKELRAYQPAWNFAYFTLLKSSIAPLLTPRMLPLLSPTSQAYWRSTREALFGTTLEELSPSHKHATQWAELERAFGVIASWLDAAGDGRTTFLGGETVVDGRLRVSHADLCIAGTLEWIRAVFGNNTAHASPHSRMKPVIMRQKADWPHWRQPPACKESGDTSRCLVVHEILRDQHPSFPH